MCLSKGLVRRLRRETGIPVRNGCIVNILENDQSSQAELLECLATRHPKVLIVGDLMLDHYRIADVTRISPEAPVPVLLNPRSEFRPGGAAAVAAMTAALGAETVLLGVVGPDRSGDILHKLLTELGVCCLAVVDPDRVTTTKERICGVASGRHRQQLGRVDCETVSPLLDDLAARLIDIISGFSEDSPDVILVADYAKGVLTGAVAQACKETGVLVIVDPPKNGRWEQYEHVGCIVPNREEAAGRNAGEIREFFNTLAAIVKLDQDGCELHDVHYGQRKIPAKPRFVHDVTGAGDQFLAVLGCVVAVGGDWETAAELATVAAGLQVERHGCTPVTIQQIRIEVDSDLSRQAVPAY